MLATLSPDPEHMMLRKTLDTVVALIVTVGLVGLLVFLVGGWPAEAVAQDENTLLERLSAEEPEDRIAALVDAGAVEAPTTTFLDRIFGLGMDRDQYVRLAAHQAMAQLGEPVNQRIGQWIDQPDPEAFKAACIAIQAMGPAAARWMPQVVDRLKNTDNYASRMAALFALEAIGPESVSALDVVAESLKAEGFDSSIRLNFQQAACRVVAAIGPPAARLAPQLVALIENEDSSVSARSRAMIALAAVGPVEGIDSVSIIRKRLHAFSVIDRERALEALGMIGPPAIAAADDVRKLVENEHRSVMPHAAYTLYRITGEREPALDVLIRLLDVYEHRNLAAIKLGEMGPDASVAAEPIAGLLDCDEAGIRESALYALSAIGSNGPTIRSAIERVAENDEDLLIRSLARRVLEGMAMDKTVRPSTLR